MKIRWPDISFGPVNLWSMPKMSETKKKVETFIVNYTCDTCGEGRMLPTGATLMSYPARYPHECSNCGSEATFKHQYPKYVHEVINE